MESGMEGSRSPLKEQRLFTGRGEQAGTPASALNTGPGNAHTLDTEGTSSRCTPEGVILVLKHGCILKVRGSCQILVSTHVCAQAPPSGSS